MTSEIPKGQRGAKAGRNPSPRPKDEDVSTYLAQMPDKLNSRHKALMRELVAGATLKEAAETVGFQYGAAAKIASSPLFKAEKEKLERDITERFIESEGARSSLLSQRRRIQGEAARSISTLIDLRDSSLSDGVKQKCAMDLLDRAGLKEPERLELSGELVVGDRVAAMLATAGLEMERLQETPESSEDTEDGDSG